MNPRTVREDIAGPAGRIEVALDRPAEAPRGVAVVCHPHPQFGGTLDNKVVQMVARTFLQLGWASARFNFRGTGRSEGSWDDGRGEVEDALAVVAGMRARSEFAGLPWSLAGFSFGGYVAATVADRLPEADKPRRLVLVGPSTEKHSLPKVAADTVVLHGEIDDVVPLSAT
ncbi:MAG: alpha/beta fold hydrolase, partial [Caldimonas sp.]